MSVHLTRIILLFISRPYSIFVLYLLPPALQTCADDEVSESEDEEEEMESGSDSEGDSQEESSDMSDVSGDEDDESGDEDEDNDSDDEDRSTDDEEEHNRISFKVSFMMIVWISVLSENDHEIDK